MRNKNNIRGFMLFKYLKFDYKLRKTKGSNGSA